MDESARAMTDEPNGDPDLIKRAILCAILILIMVIGQALREGRP